MNDILINNWQERTKVTQIPQVSSKSFTNQHIRRFKKHNAPQQDPPILPYYRKILMKCLFWNIRGISNPLSRLSLKRPVIHHKPQFVFVEEPLIHFGIFPTNQFNRLGFKIFNLNTRPNLLPKPLVVFCQTCQPNIFILK